MKAWILPEEYYYKKGWKESLEVLGVIQPDSFVKEKLFYDGVNYPIIVPKTQKWFTLIKQYELKEFEDYYFEDYVSKKIVVLYGNCHMQNLQELLNSVAEFREKYYIYTIKPIFEISDPKYFESPVFSKCDIFLHQSIRKENKYGEAYSSECVLKKLQPNCDVYSIPNIYHLAMCYFPQFIEKSELKRLNGGTVFFRDEVVEKGVKEGLSIGEIVEKYKNQKNIYSRQLIKEKWNVFLEKVKKRERDWDIKVSNFIVENRLKNRLFYDPNHPSELLMRFIATETLKLLKVEEKLSLEAVPVMDTYEIPLVRDVIDYFEFDYELKNYELRKTGAKYKNTMTIEEYVKEYFSLMWQDKTYSLYFRIKSFVMYVNMMAKHLTNKIIERIS